jgi:hypothetical protein
LRGGGRIKREKIHRGTSRILRERRQKEEQAKKGRSYEARVTQYSRAMTVEEREGEGEK